ncbi:MAG: hypothetical protein J5801_08220 [Bacteroidales bacterium]|nr:hypothetical protein [Bacteroidales bacterium]
MQNGTRPEQKTIIRWGDGFLEFFAVVPFLGLVYLPPECDLFAVRENLLFARGFSIRKNEIARADS